MKALRELAKDIHTIWVFVISAMVFIIVGGLPLWATIGLVVWWLS